MASHEDNTVTPPTVTPPTDTQRVAGAGIASEVAERAADNVAVPAKKTPAKRAPRKATKKASAPAQASEPQVTSESSVGPALTDAASSVPEVPARKTAKRAPRKSAKKSAAAPLDPAQAQAAQTGPAQTGPAQTGPAQTGPAQAEAAPADQAQAEHAQAEHAQAEHAPADQAQSDPASPTTTPEVPLFGLLFQAPEATAPRRRRATAPVAAPTPTPEKASDSNQASASDSSQASATASSQAGASDSRDSDEADDTGADGAPRRRRRGGKGRRGRATGDSGAGEAPEQDTVETSAEGSAETSSSDQTTPDQPAADDDESGDTGESRRRTRRRRRGGSGDSEDQQSGSTTTRVREPRPAREEVTSVKGSTRLEAKKQRRREGREAGRRRTVITEAEFLARRESVERVMVVRHKQDRTQIGVLEDRVLVEHYVSRETNASMAGNVYLGRIQNVLPSMEAAFVDIGKGRNAVLYAGEVNWDAAGLDNRARRIENALSSGQSVLVQVTKDPIGHKGARLTSQVSLPGRYLVYVPDGNMMGISRKLPDTERARLKKILREVVPENAGVIVRTAAEGATEDELRADVTRLTAAWEDIQAKSKGANAPALLHGEPDLTVRVIRDVFNEDFAKLVVAGEPAWETVNGYVNTVAPDLSDRVQKWTGEQDLFTHYRVDEQIAKAMDRKVWLPSGGSLVIDRTEAMTVVDVNTGKFVGSGGNLEETVTKNNIEAAEEVVRQLRLRDIGGIIVIDFIDMVLESNRDLVVRRLLECLGRDRTKHQVAEVTSLGLVQMTRKRVGAGLIEVFSENCEHCNGRGIIVSADPIDRPSGSDGSGNDVPSGGGGGSGGGQDSGNGRGSRGRRTRGSGRDAGASVEANSEPKVSQGPTPAQIAAAAHAAAIHAASQDGRATQNEADSGDETGAQSPETEQPSTQEVVHEPQQVPVEAVPPVRSRRRSRSAKSPAVSVEPQAPEPAATAPVVTEPQATQPQATELQATQPGATEPGGTEQQVSPAGSDQAAVVTAPPAPLRRKRPRVMAPAGPPPGAGQSETASGEFGS